MVDSKHHFLVSRGVPFRCFVLRFLRRSQLTESKFPEKKARHLANTAASLPLPVPVNKNGIPIAAVQQEAGKNQSCISARLFFQASGMTMSVPDGHIKHDLKIIDFPLGKWAGFPASHVSFRNKSI